jgi:hypothetical protein
MIQNNIDFDSFLQATEDHLEACLFDVNLDAS